MKKRFSVIGFCLLASFALLGVLQTGCKPAKSDEVLITTKSNEARKLFIEGRELAEYWQTEKANDLFKKAVYLDPDFALAHLFFAGTSSETKDFQEGLAKAVSLAPKASEGEQKIIAAFQASAGENNAVKANQIYQELVTLFPKDKRVHMYLASTYDTLQEFDKEIAALQNAIAADKNFAPLYERLGYVYRWKNQFDKSEANFKEYLRLNPNQAGGHDNLADLFMKMGRFEEAIQEYNQALQIDPHFSMSSFKIGTSLIFMGKYEEGRQALLKTMEIERKPANKVYDQEGIMRSYIYEGDYAKALEAADRAIQMAGELGLPDEASFNPLVKSAIYCELGDFEKADACIADCLNMLESADLVAGIKDNQKSAATFWQAVVAAGRKDFDTALARVETYKGQIAAMNNPALQKYPGWLSGYISLAQGDANKAAEHFNQGEMDHPWFMYYFALSKEKAGDTAGAEELFKKVATWNMDGVWYAFVRSKAKAKI